MPGGDVAVRLVHGILTQVYGARPGTSKAGTGAIKRRGTRCGNRNQYSGTEVQRRYFAELDQHPEGWHPLLDAVRKSDITLLFGARETEHNNAVALKAYFEKHCQGIVT